VNASSNRTVIPNAFRSNSFCNLDGSVRFSCHRGQRGGDGRSSAWEVKLRQGWARVSFNRNHAEGLRHHETKVCGRCSVHCVASAPQSY
jgi:hypothetical protein